MFLTKTPQTKEVQAMAHSNTIMNQITKIVSRHEFEALAVKHHTGRKFRKFSRWSQFVAMTAAQLSSRVSLRDLTSNLKAQMKKLYHLGVTSISRTTLARVNDEKPYTLYEELFNKLLHRCQRLSPKHTFRFKNKLYSLDATVIDLCLKVFPWATFRKTKGALKLHIGLDHSGYLPTFVSVTEGSKHEIAWARALQLPRGSFCVFDKAFTDYDWFGTLVKKGIFFITRQKINAQYRVIERRKANRSQGILCDQTILLIGQKSDLCPYPLRRIRYRDKENGKDYVYITNAIHVSARTVANIYKERWQIELFFKWIKQNLKIKSFLGTSKNAVLTQIWIAMCVYLILCWIKFQNKIDLSLQQMLRLLQLNLFERRDILKLLRGDPEKPPSVPDYQLALLLS